MKRVEKWRLEELREEVDGKEFEEGDGEESVKVNWTHGANGRGRSTKWRVEDKGGRRTVVNLGSRGGRGHA